MVLIFIGIINLIVLVYSTFNLIIWMYTLPFCNSFCFDMYVSFSLKITLFLRNHCFLLRKYSTLKIIGIILRWCAAKQTEFARQGWKQNLYALNLNDCAVSLPTVIFGMSYRFVISKPTNDFAAQYYPECKF